LDVMMLQGAFEALAKFAAKCVFRSMHKESSLDTT